MENSKINLRVSININLEPRAVFDTTIDELSIALNRKGIQFEPGEEGRIIQESLEVGKVVSWKPGNHIKLQWIPVPWQSDKSTEIEFKFEHVDEGTKLTLEYRNLDRMFDDGEDIAGWFTSEIAVNILGATTPGVFGDWITDRRTRRPSGNQARSFYRDPLYHYPGFKAILKELDLKPDDYYLEVGCGGGALLKMVLQSGCKAAAIDHSYDMVKLARKENETAIKDGRLKILESDASKLPFPDETFTCVAMAGVLGFLPAPVTALSEMKRVLKKGGRIVVQGTDPEMRGTPAAPEPIASRLKFYDSDELELLARNAGFEKVNIDRLNLEQYAKEVGIPEEHLPLFKGPGARFLIAVKD
jgi:SAM-dependent methyltransferase